VIPMPVQSMRSVVPTHLPDQWREGTGEADHFHPEPKLRMRKAVPPLPHTPVVLLYGNITFQALLSPRDRRA
jgi:hypothetical protein